ncbi:uncharacterized protein DFL_003718 [Arthrobotrys flagrans]|uniref:Uncharacterized protein n=1 Tax=Arthrobotrys flagrans TaxID=97331 RepID=A0A437A2P0_ARTFL|nr:hypothetical protein DFL_003718 [Arthrobotrys flagrans]
MTVTGLPNNLQVGYATDFPSELSTEDSYRCEINASWPKYMGLGEADIMVPLRKDPWLRQFQVLVVYKAPDSSTMRLVGMGSSIPFYWPTPNDNDTLPDGGWDAVGALGIRQHYFRNNMTEKLQAFKARTLPDVPARPWDASYSGGETPNTLCALAVCILQEFRTPGLAERIIGLMRDKCMAEDYQAYVVPVRPTRKTEFKAMQMPIYLQMGRNCEVETNNGADVLVRKDTFDPWVRKHLSIGGTPIKIANTSITLRAKGRCWDDSADKPGMCEKAWKEGNVQINEHDGEEYVNVYDVPGTLGPVRYYWRRDEGVYCEPNLWIRHI